MEFTPTLTLGGPRAARFTVSYFDYLSLVVCFVVTTFGLGLALARRWFPDEVEGLCAAAVIGLTASFVMNFLFYINFISMKWFSLLPLLGVIGLGWERRTISSWWTNIEARQTLLGWIIVAAWTQFLAMTIVGFGGGAWGGDWLEHHQRANFFREHLPLRLMFVGEYLLPARPPLVNVVTAGYQSISVAVYACDQAVIGLWSSLVFLPAALFCRRAGGKGRAVATLTVLFLLNPSFLQNSTFAWTKLPAVFFVLVGAHFIFRSLEQPAASKNFVLAAVALSAALLAHYSAGPYCGVLIFWWLAARLYQRHFGLLSREIAIGLVVVVPLLGLWLGWAASAYGLADTFLSNSSVLETGPKTIGIQAVKIIGNLWATLVPHPFREVDYILLWQASSLGWFRDYFFMIVQVNFFGLMGTGGALALAVSLWRGCRGTPRQAEAGVLRQRWLWIAVGACTLLGVAVHGAADEWGLAHICLQPLGMMGLAVLAARLWSSGPLGFTILGIGLAWDAAVNVGLHYWLQAQPPDPAWLVSSHPVAIYLHHGTSAFNACLKEITLTRFLSDTLPGAGLVGPLAIMFVASLVWWRSIHPSKSSQPPV